MDISVVVPLYNEEESLPELFAWIERVMNCLLYTSGPLTINTFIKIDDKAIPAGNCFDQRGKKKKAEKKVE